MNEMTPPPDETMSPVKRALLEIRDLRARLARAEAARPAEARPAEARPVTAEPIAIVGMGLRFPGGAHDAESFAELLWSGRDAIGPIPSDRWPVDSFFAADPDAPGKMTTRQGGFLDEIDQFDADFFGIAPREAASMDPQQRLFLEVSWEALENAGQSPAALAGSSTGVYLGISNSDYGRALLARPDLIDAYAGTGSAFSIVPGRLSYILGLQGPSIAVDTACSSSLVALHLACQALRLGECDLALAGGINLILAPEMNITFTKARMMAPDGRCKTFDASADGYVRGEGVGVVVLRRLSDAQARHDRILAVVRGSAVNQDGHSQGLTAPNGPAQEAVIRAALTAAGVPATAVGYVEAHGTGTPLGDPIEVGALASVYAPGREMARPLALGSVKTNLGHLEAAAGVAGVIKAVLSLQRREVPPNLHFRTGNPRIDWATLPITVPVRALPLAPAQGACFAAVSGFGFSGCNAHVILEEAPRAEAARPAENGRPLHILALSARAPSSLAVLAERHEAALATAEPDAADLCFTANTGRSHFAERLAVIGGTAAELRQSLATVTAEPHDAGEVPRVAFLFTGQGAQYPGMGLALHETSPAFRDALDSCAKGLAPHLQPGLLDVLRGTEPGVSIHRTAYAQPALFAIEYALAMLWRSWGIEPVAVMGHSLGEYTAACIAGVFPLSDALRLVAERGRLTEALAEDGTMAAVFGPEAAIMAAVADSGGALAVAAYNGPEHLVLSGERAAMSVALDRLQGAGLRVRPLKLSYAAHSRLIEPVQPAFRPALDATTFASPRMALVSNVTGALAGAEIAGPDYWLAHMRAPVLFARSVQALSALGVTHLVEIGPQPVLLGMAAESMGAGPAVFLPSLRRDRAPWPELLDSLRRLYLDGADIDWEGFDRGHARRRLTLPTYPFRRRRHWIDTEAAAMPRDDEAGGWPHMLGAMDRQASQGPFDLNPSSYPAKWDCLARLTSAHAIRTLRESGLFARAGERLTLPEIAAAAGILDAYGRVLRRWLDDLVARGLLRAEGDGWVSPAPLPEPGLDALWAEAEMLFADNRPLLAYVRHCGGLLGRVLRGAESPLETLFPQGSFALAEGLYEHSTTMRYVNGLAAVAVASACAKLPGQRLARVMEIGAGTGSTSAAVLAALPADRVSYRFTDVSDVFLARARERFGARAGVSFGQFDLDRDPGGQGHAPGNADVILAANAVHASVDLRAALRRLHDLLAPGGVLVLVESTTHFAWFDMTTGLIEGWQHFADDLRGEQPLLAAPAWVEALREAGFEAAMTWPRDGSPAARLGQHVVVARVAGSAPAVTVTAEGPAIEDRPAAAPAIARDGTREAVAVALPEERLDLLREFVGSAVTRVLRRDPSDMPGRHARLTDLGLDSLMAVQLRGELGRGLALDADLPASLMFDHPTIDRLATHLLQRLHPETAARSPEINPAISDPPKPLGESALAEMSDDEVATLLAARFGARTTLEGADVSHEI
jgi:acyl transferase domain-containing protein/SAM-dependent methyltransferase